MKKYPESVRKVYPLYQYLEPQSFVSIDKYMLIDTLRGVVAIEGDDLFKLVRRAIEVMPGSDQAIIYRALKARHERK